MCFTVCSNRKQVSVQVNTVSVQNQTRKLMKWKQVCAPGWNVEHFVVQGYRRRWIGPIVNPVQHFHNDCPTHFTTEQTMDNARIVNGTTEKRWSDYPQSAY